MNSGNAFGGGRGALTQLALRSVLAAILAVLVLSGQPSAYAVVVTDNFSDLNDTANPTWTHLDAAVGPTDDPTNPDPLIVGYFQKWDASSGALRLCTPTSPSGSCDPANATFGSTVPGIEGYDFVGARVGPTFTDVRVTADIVDFVPPGDGTTSPASSFFAVAARLNGVNLPPSEANGLEFRGYAYQYEGTADYVDPISGEIMFGEMVLAILHGDGIKDVGSFPLTLDAAKDYRVVFEVVGNTLHGQVFEVTDVANGGILGPMVADQFRDLDANPPGLEYYDGLLNPEREFIPYTSGYSGVYGIGHILATDADFTIDNFRTESIGGLTGDYNENGVVDAADYVLWRNGGPLGNDATPGVQPEDYGVWKANFGNTPGSGSGLGSSAVPEPASAALVLLGLVSLWFGRRHAGR